jgi:hypothetical protein
VDPGEDRWDEALADLLAGAVPEAPPEGGLPVDGAPSPLADGAPAASRDKVVEPDIDPVKPDPPARRGELGEPSPGDPDEPPELNLPEVAVLVIPCDDASLLAALLKGPKVDARVIVKEGLGFAVLANPTEAAALTAVVGVSRTLTDVPILLLHRGPSDNPGAADLQAYHYENGQEQATLPGGLVLAQSPQVLEDLLIDPPEAERALRHAIDSGEMTVEQAIRIIHNDRRRRPRRGRGDE